LIEDQKSYNWRKASPMTVNIGSAFVNELSQLNTRERVRMIEFMLDPEHKEFPKAVIKKLEQGVYKSVLDEAKRQSDMTRQTPEGIQREAEEAAMQMKLQVETALMDATPFERIPLLELLIESGSGALSSQPGYPTFLIRDFLGYKKDSYKGKWLLAFLRIIPQHEKSVTLAYLLSQSGEDKTSLLDIFAVFQSMGFKVSQVGDTLGLWDTKEQKSNAKAMSKYEIEQAMEVLTPQERARVKRMVRILGSASMKTVVEVELEGGDHVAMYVQRPYAAEQITSNLAFGKRFVAEIKRTGTTGPLGVLELMIAAIEKQLRRALKMKDEEGKMIEAEKAYRDLNKTMQASLAGWKFKVPLPVAGFQVRDTIMFVELAKGETLDKLAKTVYEKVIKVVGPGIVASSLRILFRLGRLDTERHIGNQLVDVENKVIYPLDFEQWIHFDSDELYVLGQFFKGGCRAQCGCDCGIWSADAGGSVGWRSGTAKRRHTGGGPLRRQSSATAYGNDTCF